MNSYLLALVIACVVCLLFFVLWSLGRWVPFLEQMVTLKNRELNDKTNHAKTGLPPTCDSKKAKALISEARRLKQFSVLCGSNVGMRVAQTEQYVQAIMLVIIERELQKNLRDAQAELVRIASGTVFNLNRIGDLRYFGDLCLAEKKVRKAFDQLVAITPELPEERERFRLRFTNAMQAQ